MNQNCLCLFLLVPLLPLCAAAAQPWDKYVLAPAGRVVAPRAPLFPVVLKYENASASPFVLLDFGKEVGGFVSIEVGAVSGGTSAHLGLTFSESADYAACPSTAANSHCPNVPGRANQMYSGDDSNGGGDPSPHPDGAVLTGPVGPDSIFRVKSSHLRGGFRYLNVFVAGNDSIVVEIKSVHVTFTAAPRMQNLRQYENHFFSSDDLLNRIWYAAAYTAQMCLISPQHGRAWLPPTSGWNNDVLIGLGDSIIVDGAKRDRTIWPGDMGISIATTFATLGDVQSGINSLLTLYSLQSPAGQLPYVGPAVFCQKPEGAPCGGQGMWGSDTYHLWALVGSHLSATYAANNSMAFLHDIYDRYKKAVDHSLSKVVTMRGGGNTSTGSVAQGLFVVDQTADWQRSGQGGQNIAANALLYRVTQGAVELARMMQDTKAALRYQTAGEALKCAINAVLWDETRHAYRDNPTSVIFPQDGNSLAVWFNITDSADKRAGVLAYLKSNWGELGAISPEWVYQGKGAIGTFPSSMEVFAWLSSLRRAKEGISLIKRTWGYMLNSPNSTQSTFWEGFQADGQFAFEGIYMSHAHGWSTGPAPALTFHVLGLRRGKWGRHDYEVVPSFSSASGLAFCEGSLSFGAAGKVFVRWEASSTLTVDASAYARSVGLIGIPTDDALRSIRVGNSEVWDHATNKSTGGDEAYANARDQVGLGRTVEERGGRVWITLAKPGRIMLALVRE
jgi:hypothetical protein